MSITQAMVLLATNAQCASRDCSERHLRTFDRDGHDHESAILLVGAILAAIAVGTAIVAFIAA